MIMIAWVNYRRPTFLLTTSVSLGRARRTVAKVMQCRNLDRCARGGVVNVTAVAAPYMNCTPCILDRFPFPPLPSRGEGGSARLRRRLNSLFLLVLLPMYYYYYYLQRR
ncbi:hypothetical protein F4815DRAFT_38800 [Daldinia loculata]|nr:hypothetical protein F4815DRAFT_38800 [Daldinia loculata]